MYFNVLTSIGAPYKCAEYFYENKKLQKKVR